MTNNITVDDKLMLHGPDVEGYRINRFDITDDRKALFIRLNKRQNNVDKQIELTVPIYEFLQIILNNNAKNL